MNWKTQYIIDVSSPEIDIQFLKLELELTHIILVSDVQHDLTFICIVEMITTISLLNIQHHIY